MCRLVAALSLIHASLDSDSGRIDDLQPHQEYLQVRIGPEWLSDLAELSRSETSVLVLFVVALVLVGVNVTIGRRQKREGRGTWRRLLAVALAIALLQLMPLVAAVSLFVAGVRSEIPVAALLIAYINVMVLFATLGPPARFLHSRTPLPLVEDDAFLARVAELSGRMGLPLPVVRLLPTGGGELQAQALAGGLVAPSLVVADGILHRLAPNERDATMAHELAHLANRSLWWLTAAAPIGATAGVVISFWFPFGLACAYAFAVWIGVLHLFSRYFEYDCDRWAAEVLGYRTMYSALTKIHAASPLRNQGWLSLLVFATATHPSRAQRLAALWEVAPAGDRPTVTWSADDLRLRRRAGWVAVFVWLVALVAIPLWSRRQPDSYWPTTVLIVVGAIPWLAMLAATRQATRYLRRRMRARGRYRWQVLFILAGLLLLIAPLVGDNLAISAMIVIALPVLMLCSLWLLLRGSRGRQVMQQVALAMQTRDFDKVAKLAEEHAETFAWSAPLRHNLGFALAMSGDRDRAISVLQDLNRDEPGFAESTLVLAMLHVDEGHPEKALPLVEEVQRTLPRDPTPLMLKGHVLHLLERLDEAQECIECTLELKPDSGHAHAIAGWIALDRGEPQQAIALLEQADELDPGTPFIERVKAEIALAGEDLQAARRQVERAVAASDANPYALLQNQVLGLKERLSAFDTPGDPTGPESEVAHIDRRSGEP